jgi:signal transduction histidine kinase
MKSSAQSAFALHLGWSALLCCTLLAAAAMDQAPSAAEVRVDGQTLEARAQGIRIPASHKAVSFRLGRAPGDAGEGTRRMRFRLDGVDSGWRQIESEMCLMVRFTDAAGDQVGQRIFPVDGISAGWRGEIESSTFTPRRETVSVPAGSARVTVAISSSGPPTAMGVYAVRGLKILRSVPAELVFETKAGSDSEVAPPGWGRSGTRPSMARMVHTGAGDAFCIVDDDPSAHAEWNLSRAAAPTVQPGELLTLEWAEMYNIGMGNRFEVNYGRLSAGTYRFWSEELDASGKSVIDPRRLDFVVLEPVWKNAWFWISATAPLGFLLWMGCRTIIQRRIRQQLARVEQEHMIERERLRIARDLHDDLGARLTHISLVSGLAENDPQSASARESFRHISGMARELVAALYQTVWTVNPENDHLEALIHFLGQLAQNLCEPAGLRCRVHSCTVPSGRRMTSEVRHHITLAVKEAVHNAIKHAGATEITVRIEFADPRLRIVIADNGHGFDPATVAPGHGLANMRRRMEAMGGTMDVEHSSEPGTRIHFEVPIPATAATKPSTASRADEK